MNVDENKNDEKDWMFNWSKFTSRSYMDAVALLENVLPRKYNINEGH